MELYGRVSWTKYGGFDVVRVDHCREELVEALQKKETLDSGIVDWRVFKFKPEQMIARSEFIEDRFEEYHAGAKERDKRVKDREQCKEMIFGEYRPHRCERKAKIEGYCKQHYNMNQRRVGK